MEYIDSIKCIPEFHVHIPDHCYIYTSVFPFHITLYGYHVKYIWVYMWWKHFILVLIPWDHIVICDTLGFHVQISTILSVYMYTRVQVQAHSVWSKWCSFFITLPKCTSYIQIFNRVFFMELLIFVTSSSNTNRLKYSHWFWKTNFGILSVNRHKSVCVV